MTVSITISGTSGGDSLADNVDLGSVDASGETSYQDLFIRHDANVAKITDCAFYMTKYTGTGYLGSDVDADYTEVLAWGDAANDDGFILNQNAAGWVSGQFPTGSDQFIKSTGGTIDTPLTLLTTAINIGTPDEAGDIPLAGEAHVQARIKVPSTVASGAGYRAVQFVMAYSATS